MAESPASVIPEDRSSPPLLVSIAEAQRLLGDVSERHVRSLCQQGILRSRREGRRRLIYYSSLVEYVGAA